MSGIGVLGFVVGLVVLVLDILAIVDIIRRPMETGMKILWVVLIIWLPVIGLILYYLLGRGKQTAGS
jgi:hypothetical protein